MHCFKEHYKDYWKGNSRHDPLTNPLHTTDIDKHYQRKTLNVIGNVHKQKPGSNLIEMLKKRSGRHFCQPQDVDYIKQSFLKGILPKPGEVRQLGSTGINFYQSNGKWVVEKV